MSGAGMNRIGVSAEEGVCRLSAAPPPGRRAGLMGQVPATGERPRGDQLAVALH